jgi:uncharacterized protein YbaP (TraB family)
MTHTRLDRAAAVSLAALAGLHLLFLLAFLVSLKLAVGAAHAEAPACTGKDMLAGLQASDPALFDRIAGEARAVANGKGLLWRIGKDGQQPSYLFGTMHMADPRVVTLPPDAQARFDAASTVVIETTEVLDQAAMMAALARDPGLMMFTDGTTLMSLLPPEDAPAVEEALRRRGIPPASVNKMKPWMLAAMVSLPACEFARKAAGAPVLDVKLAENAKAAGKTLLGLETVKGQLSAMASLPMDLHVRGLVETLKLGDRIDDVVETMIVLYLRGDIGMIFPLFRAVLPSGGDPNEGYAEFEQAMITSRNHGMVEHALPILAQGNAFIAVGALHLTGAEGLVELLRKAGYTVTPEGRP